jgi:hypothetical protein
MSSGVQAQGAARGAIEDGQAVRVRGDLGAPRVEAIVGASRRGILPLCFGREPATVPRTERGSFVPIDTIHRQRFVSGRHASPGGLRAAEGRIAQRSGSRGALFQQLATRCPGCAGWRRAGGRWGPVVCFEEAPVAADRHLEVVEPKSAHCDGVLWELVGGPGGRVRAPVRRTATHFEGAARNQG